MKSNNEANGKLPTRMQAKPASRPKYVARAAFGPAYPSIVRFRYRVFGRRAPGLLPLALLGCPPPPDLMTPSAESAERASEDTNDQSLSDADVGTDDSRTGSAMTTTSNSASLDDEATVTTTTTPSSTSGEAFVDCPPAPMECQSDGSGAVCIPEAPAFYSTCILNEDGCMSLSPPSVCEVGWCQGAPGEASCGCPPQPIDCTGAGTVCRDGAIVICGEDAQGCIVTEETRPCDAPRECEGEFPNADCECPVPSECGQGEGSFCVASSLYTCATGTSGCFDVRAEECSPIFCVGTFPNGRCQGVVALGSATDLGGQSDHDANALLGIQITVDAPARLQYFGLIARETGLVNMALYAGVPPTVLVSGASVIAQPVVEGVNEFPVLEQPTLQPGTYWIMAVFQNVTRIAHGTTVDTVIQYIDHSFSSPLPSTLPPPFAYTDRNMNYYILALPE